MRCRDDYFASDPDSGWGGAPLGEPFRDLCRGHRTGYEISLNGVAVEVVKPVQSLFFLDAFGHHAQIKRVGCLDRELDERVLAWV
jgi:hypothetical protein